MANFKKLAYAVATLGAVMSSPSVFATHENTTGKVIFNGQLQAETCQVDSGSREQTVTLPKLSTSTFSAVGTIAGSTPFSIKVDNCDATVAQVAAHFETVGSTGINPTTNNLLNAFTPTGETDTRTAATNVEIRLFDGTGRTQVRPGTTGAYTNVVGTGTARGATLPYNAAYYGTATTAGAGQVHAEILFTLAYP